MNEAPFREPRVCPEGDLNPHAFALEPESSVSANSTIWAGAGVFIARQARECQAQTLGSPRSQTLMLRRIAGGYQWRGGTARFAYFVANL